MGEFDHIVAALHASPVARAFKEMGESGDFSRLDGNQAKRHHFLPQFPLHGFAQERGGKERLFQMETASRGAPRPVDFRTAASRRRLYTAIGEDGEPSNRNAGYPALPSKQGQTPESAQTTTPHTTGSGSHADSEAAAGGAKSSSTRRVAASARPR
jgi:hypothetical protein